MGASQSTQRESPQNSPVTFVKPWRHTPWDEKERLEKYLREFQLSHPNVEYVRILVTGEIGAGKSSFIESINSAFQKRITSEALGNATSCTSFTKRYKTYSIKSGQSILPFVFNDVMGLESQESRGAHQEDIVKALQGSLKEGHKFNPVSPVSAADEGNTSNPTPQDKTHCLVYVMAADKVSLMSSEVIKKMEYVRTKASEMDIPQVIILTRVDESCPLVHECLRDIYISKQIKDKMERCSNLVGVPMNNIFPVKNYHEEIDMQNDIDVLLLRALKHIVEIANDKLGRKDEVKSE